MNIIHTTVVIALSSLLLCAQGCATKRTITSEKRMSGYTTTAKSTKSKEKTEKKEKPFYSGWKMPFAD